MSDDHHCGAARPRLADSPDQCRFARLIQECIGLVEYQQLRVAVERPCQCNTLRLPRG